MEYQRQQLLAERQQFHQEQLRAAEMRARAGYMTSPLSTPNPGQPSAQQPQAMPQQPGTPQAAQATQPQQQQGKPQQPNQQDIQKLPTQGQPGSAPPGQQYQMVQGQDQANRPHPTTQGTSCSTQSPTLRTF